MVAVVLADAQGLEHLHAPILGFLLNQTNFYAHYGTFCSEDINSPWLQPGVVAMPSDPGFSPNLKIQAVAKAESKRRRHNPRLKPGAIHVLRV